MVVDTREWIETNYFGSYSSSGINLNNTRKYHGLLVTRWDDGWFVWLNKLEEELVFSGKTRKMTGACYAGLEAIPENLVAFNYYPYPHWEYADCEVKFVREMVLLREQNVLLIKYQLFSKQISAASLVLRPMFSCRDRHRLQVHNNLTNDTFEQIPGGIKYCQYEGLATVWLQSSGEMSNNQRGVWYSNLKYEEEIKRGYEGYEDLYNLVELKLNLEVGKPVVVSVSLDAVKEDLIFLWNKETKTRIVENKEPPLFSRLVQAASQFLTNQGEIIAGFPWFGVWTRDAMIALPGLTLTNGKEKVALQILQNFSRFEKQGELPNYLSKETSSYNSIDASLWFMWATIAYYRTTLDKRGLQSLMPVLIKLVEKHLEGTILGVRADETGLIYSESLDNVTWMDAKIKDQVITPRFGYIVELNALWYYGLVFMEEWMVGGLKKTVQTLIAKFNENFEALFWNEKAGYLNDFVSKEIINEQLRPNQLWAVALDLPLSNVKKQRIVEITREHLLTPYGLRTLSPQDPNYSGYYSGDQPKRDKSYHNGTVWPWLLGVFTEAVLKVGGDLSFWKEVESRLCGHLADYGLGGIAEVFDGNEPHTPNGCINQAWSVAEILRIYSLLKI